MRRGALRTTVTDSVAGSSSSQGTTRSADANRFRERSRVIREDFARAANHDMMVKIQELQSPHSGRS